MKGYFALVAGLWAMISVVAAEAGSLEPLVLRGVVAESQACDTSKTTICTMEIWLAHAQEKRDKEVRQRLDERSIKILRKTIQYWKRRGGHPPTNVAIGSGISAEDARFVIEMALEFNDKVESLVIQSLNPPHYVAVATSAWDEKSQIPITGEDLARLRDPSLTTEQFHQLYLKLTGETGKPRPFY